jgi:hypothetical protein
MKGNAVKVINEVAEKSPGNDYNGNEMEEIIN